MRRSFERGTRNCHQTIFREVWSLYKENVAQKIFSFFLTLMKLRLDFVFTDLSQHFEIDLVFFVLYFLFMDMGER